MKRLLITLAVLALFVGVAAVPAVGGDGVGELNASFHAGLSGGSAIDVHSDVADGVASPQINPEGRLEPFGGLEEVCDQLPVGTWVFIFDPDRSVLDGWTNEFKLDGDPLDTVRTPNKRISQGEFKGQWWFAEGVPVLGVLDPGVYDIEWTAQSGALPPFTINTPVIVDSAYCS